MAHELLGLGLSLALGLALGHSLLTRRRANFLFSGA